MKDMNKIIMAASVFIIVAAVTYFGTEYILREKTINTGIPETQTEENKDKGNNPDGVTDIKENVFFYRINEKGELIKEEISINGNNQLKSMLDYMFKKYGEYPENERIKISPDVKVLDYEVKMGTLYINLSKEIEDTEMLDKNTEDAFINTFSSSLYPFSKSMNFQDFQFLVEGKEHSSIFNNTQTNMPRLVIP